MSRGGFANRQAVILMIQACPPPKPACFGLDKTWRDWLVQAHQSGLRVVRIVEFKNAEGCRSTQRRLLDTPQIPYCTECTAGHQRAMQTQNRCHPSAAMAFETAEA